VLFFGDSVSSPKSRRDLTMRLALHCICDIFSNALDQSSHDINDNSSSSLLYTSAYPPNEFSTSSMTDDDLTPTPAATTSYPKQQQQQLSAVSIDEDDDNPLIEQSNSPTHTISSNGHDTVSLYLSFQLARSSCSLLSF
jgi:hypothetical protein